MLYSGGAEAVESALRLARAHTKKHEAIAFWGGFHGKTTGALALMGSDFKHGLGPLPPGNYLSPWGDLEMLERTIKLSTTRQARRHPRRADPGHRRQPACRRPASSPACARSRTSTARSSSPTR